MAQYDLQKVYSEVQELILDSLDKPGEPCDLSTRLIDDLEAESLDYLDIAFRIERAYRVKIKRGRIEKSLRARLPDFSIKPNTDVTDELREVIKEFMPEVPPARIDSISKVKEISSLFTVGTFVRTAVLAILETYPDAQFTSSPIEGYDPAQLGLAPIAAE